jgi:hypothetical protein
MTKTMKTLACVVALIGAVGASAQSNVVAATGASTSASTSTSTDSAKSDEAPVSDLNVTRLIVGTGVSEREPVGAASTFTTGSATKLVAFIEVENPKAEAKTVEVVWIDLASGKERGHYTLSIGASKRWRTWGRTAAPKKPGEYAVLVRDENGIELARTAFTMSE